MSIKIGQRVSILAFDKIPKDPMYCVDGADEYFGISRCHYDEYAGGEYRVKFAGDTACILQGLPTGPSFFYWPVEALVPLEEALK